MAEDNCWMLDDLALDLTNSTVQSVMYDNTAPADGYSVNTNAKNSGSYCYGNGTSAGASSGNATEDICPAGWHMPSGGSSGNYNNLYNGNYGYNTVDTNFRGRRTTCICDVDAI